MEANKEKEIVWIKHHTGKKHCEICYKEPLTKGIYKHYTISYTYPYKGHYDENKLINSFNEKYNNKVIKKTLFKKFVYLILLLIKKIKNVFSK